MQSYFQKHALYPPFVQKLPPADLDLIVVIPAFNEPELVHAVQSILSCQRNDICIEIIVVLNYPDSQPNLQSFHEFQRKELLGLNVDNANEILDLPVFSLPVKDAGVGLARKIGMDEACYRFESINKNGIILCFDADCSCHPDYLKLVVDGFKNMPNQNALTIGFKHRLQDLTESNLEAIIQYELHLRTYIGWQKFYKYPMAFQTLGSCMAVRSKAYQQQGGMNKRKAGEDFYFLHKYSVLSQLAELRPLLVYPSSRISDRVPFGTGKAVRDIINSKSQHMSYNPKGIASYCDFYNLLCDSWPLIEGGRSWKSLTNSIALTSYLMQVNFEEALIENIKNSTTAKVFASRMGRFLNPFRLMKFLHAASETEFPEIPVLDSAKQLLIANHGKPLKQPSSLIELLENMQV